MERIAYTSVKQQIEKLKNQHLIIADEQRAEMMLSLFGYSNIVKSYREPYTFIDEGRKVYRSGITFEQLFSLYLLDKNLRNSVIATMIDLEEYIKAAAADVVGQAFGTHQDEYLAFRNYSNKTKRKPQFTLSGVLETMRSTLATDKNPIYHYITQYGSVPPWILFKSVYFSTIVNFIDQFKTPQKNIMVHKLYDLESLQLSEESGRKLMMDTLYICLEYRNIAAHGGRTYNYLPNYSSRIPEIMQFPAENNISGFGQLLFILYLLKYQEPHRRLSNALSKELNRHCNTYPQDVTYLGQILNMNIEPQKIVWISPNSNKYHNNPHCSGMLDARKIPFDSEEIKEYIPCKRCN